MDLGVAKLITLLDLIGLDLDACARPSQGRALQLASQTASVSYKTVLDPKALAATLIDGALPASITLQVATLLDEVPLSLILATVEEVAARSHLAPKTIWRHLLKWAQDLQSPRAVWAP